MRRGDLVTIARQGTYGKPRPALVIQSDLFAEYPSVTILPVTSELRSTPLFRISVEPSETNRLRKTFEIMADRVQSVPREKIGDVFGHLAEENTLPLAERWRSFSEWCDVAV